VLRLLVLVMALMALLASPAFAQLTPATNSSEQPVTVPDDISPAEVRDMVSRLSDGQVRELLLQRLDAVAAENAAPEGARQGLPDFVMSLAESIGDSLIVSVERLPRLVVTQAKAFATFYQARGVIGMGEFVGLTLIAFVIGMLGALLTNRLAGRWKDRIADAGNDLPLKESLKLLVVRLLLDASGLIVLMVVSGLVVNQLMTEADRPFGRLILMCLVILPMGAASLSRFLLAPYRPPLRLVRTDDRTALVLHRHQIALALLIGLQIAVLDFNARNGVPIGELRLGFWFTAATFAYIAFMVWWMREGLKLMLRGWDDDLSDFETRLANAFPYIVVISCGVIWLLVEALVSQGRFDLVVDGQHYLTLMIIVMVPALDTMIRGLVRHLVPPMTGEGAIAEEAYRATKRSYIRIGRVLVFGLAVVVLAGIWEIDFENLASAGLGAQAAARFIEVLFIIVVGFLVFEVVTLWINRKLASEMTAAGVDMNAEEPGGGEGGQAGGSRLSTVLPLICWVMQTAIITITLLVALGNIGLDITPLLAGAGIVGLAIGFGAQKLVSDIVSGIFFLIDDAFRTGEYVEIDTTLGTVEKISLRSLQLRHHRGAIHTIPFGEIPKITNYSRDWVIMKLKFTVPFDTDLKKVKDIFKKIGKDIQQIPELAEHMMQTFKSQGVLEVDDVGIVVRGKFMAKPGQQFTIRKEIYNRVQKEFDANGIQFARREVRVNLNKGDPDGLTEDERQAVATAAAEAAKPVDPRPV
jgi:small-conductance mechanosensitive channel